MTDRLFEKQQAAAEEAERRVYDSARLLTLRFLEYGGQLTLFEDKKHWAFIVDPVASETRETPIGYTSFDKWLRAQSALSYSMARLAMQVYHRLLVEANIPEEKLAQIDIGKFAALMPEVESIRNMPTEKAIANSPPDVLTALDVDIWKKEQIAEWVEFAAGDGVTRKEIMARRTDAEGWEILWSGWASMDEDIAGKINEAITQDDSGNFKPEWRDWANTPIGAPHPMDTVHVTVKRLVKQSERKPEESKPKETKTDGKQDKPVIAVELRE